MLLRNLTIIITTFLTLYCGAIIFSALSSCTKAPAVSAPVVIQSVDAVTENIEKLVANINEKVPPYNVVLKSDIERIAKLIPYLIEGAGYDKFEYTFKYWVCPFNHFHMSTKIMPKNLSEPQIFELDGMYKYSDNDV